MRTQELRNPASRVELRAAALVLALVACGCEARAVANSAPLPNVTETPCEFEARGRTVEVWIDRLGASAAAERSEAVAALKRFALCVAPQPGSLSDFWLPLTDDEEAYRRSTARRRAERQDATRAIDALIGALDDPDRNVRLGAVGALVAFGGWAHEASPRLRKLAASESDREIREAAGVAASRVEGWVPGGN